MVEKLNDALVTDYLVGPELIDHYGHVNYMNYPRIYEVGQDDFMLRRGWPFERMEKELGLKIVVPAFNVGCLGEVKAGELIQILTQLKMGNTSLTFNQQLTGEDVVLNQYQLTAVLLGENGKVRIPDNMRADLTR